MAIADPTRSYYAVAVGERHVLTVRENISRSAIFLGNQRPQFHRARVTGKRMRNSSIRALADPIAIQAI
jgi:hypothetical protein